jgi:hypothetical protein
MRCLTCSDPLLHCHDVSVEHSDGTTSCLGAPRCDTPHAAHEWQLPCASVDPACPCLVDVAAVDLDTLADALAA